MGYSISDNADDNWSTMMQIIEDTGADAETVLRWITNWHGTQLLNRDFMENLVNCEL